MKKTLKRLTAVLFSTTLAASAAIASIPAAYADYTVTINKPLTDTATHTYEAYQVFSGTLHGSGEDAVLSDIQWGSGVDGPALLTALQAATFTVENPFTSCTTAQQVAEKIDSWSDNSADVQKLADIVSKNLKSTPTVTGTAGNNKLSISTPGYYFIKDKDDTLDSQNSGAYTDFILKVVDTVSIDAKEDVPSITKKIVEGTELKEANTASIGDIVTFQLNSTVPDMSAYNKYYYVINDTMCEGLTFNPASVQIYIGSDLVPSSNYEVQTGTAAKVGSVQYSFQIVMKNFKANYGAKKGDTIKVTYSAELNDNADRTETGNENKVNLTYSNNPNHEYVGDNEPSTTPGDGDVTGITPDSNTKTYTTSLLLNKIDGADSSALAGAKFKLNGLGVNKVIIANANSFVEDSAGTYYKLTDGTYTLTAPTAETTSQYADTTKKYKLNTSSTLHSETGENSYVEGITDSMGKISFAGLGAGTYTLTETEAPTNYNKLTSPITITITAAPTLSGPNWTVKKGEEALTKPTGIYELTIANNKGVTLPGTGGIGTTIFYIVGGILVCGAIVLLIAKKRFNTKEN